MNVILFAVPRFCFAVTCDILRFNSLSSFALIVWFSYKKNVPDEFHVCHVMRISRLLRHCKNNYEILKVY